MRGQIGRGRLVVMVMHTQCVRTQEPRHVAREVTPRSAFRPGVARARVLSAFVGGAASATLDPDVRVAPLRDPIRASAADRRALYAPSDPWDPWPPQRVGYDAPSGDRACDPLFPHRDDLHRLSMYLERVR